MLWRMLLCEWNKLRASNVWIPVLAAPFLAILTGLLVLAQSGGFQTAPDAWQPIYDGVVSGYSVWFLPILAGVLASLCCRLEHLAGGWKQLLALPVRRTAIYAAKFILVLSLLALAQIGAGAGMVAVGLIFRIAAPLPWVMLGQGMIGGWLAALPLAALQLWVSSGWKSFGAPFALNIILTIPAYALGNSSVYAPFYPWSQPMLAMLPGAQGVLSMTPETAMTVTISGMIFIMGGWLHFIRRDLCD